MKPRLRCYGGHSLCRLLLTQFCLVFVNHMVRKAKPGQQTVLTVQDAAMKTDKTGFDIDNSANHRLRSSSEYT